MTLDQTSALPRLLVNRSDVAAGPMSSAVERIEPMAIDDSPTAIAIASMNKMPTSRVRMPRAAARSGLIELNSSGR